MAGPTTGTNPPANTQQRERNFYTAMTLALAAGVFVGFARTFYMQPLFPESAEFIPPERFFRLHGIVFSTWIVLLVVQSWLVRTRRLAFHRQLGVAGFVVAAVVVATGTYGALIAANRPGGFIGVPLPPEAFLLVPLSDIAIFGVLVGLALHFRNQPQTHKRLMLFATLSICQAAFVRINPSFLGEFAGPIMQVALTLIFVIVVAIWDLRTEGRLNRVTLWAGIPLFLSQPLRIPIAETETWQSIGRSLMQLV